MKKRIIALLLSAVLCMGLIGVASAEIDFPDDNGNGTQMGGNVTATDPPSTSTTEPTTPPTSEPTVPPTSEPTAPPTQRPSNPGSSSGDSGSSGTTSTPSYNVSSGSGSSDNGSWTSDKSTAKSGDTVTVTATPKDGYEVDSVTVKDASGNTFTVKDLGDNKFSFTMPNGTVTVGVTFKESAPEKAPETPPVSFSDVSAGSWYYDDMAYVVSNGLMNGVGNGQFNPGGTADRKMVMTILARMSGLDTSSSNPW
ncbi:MAG: S-layer homology domain-containing protein [Acutalibacter sp.]|nr:S-layer homology domain-containing protein [Acutalibacter sp.]